jgi:hypothetical protein
VEARYNLHAESEEGFGNFTERGDSMRNPKFKEIKPNYRKNVWRSRCGMERR